MLAWLVNLLTSDLYRARHPSSSLFILTSPVVTPPNTYNLFSFFHQKLHVHSSVPFLHYSPGVGDLKGETLSLSPLLGWRTGWQSKGTPLRGWVTAPDYVGEFSRCLAGGQLPRGDWCPLSPEVQEVEVYLLQLVELFCFALTWVSQ